MKKNLYISAILLASATASSTMAATIGSKEAAYKASISQACPPEYFEKLDNTPIGKIDGLINLIDDYLAGPVCDAKEEVVPTVPFNLLIIGGGIGTGDSTYKKIEDIRKHKTNLYICIEEFYKNNPDAIKNTIFYSIDPKKGEHDWLYGKGHAMQGSANYFSTRLALAKKIIDSGQKISDGFYMMFFRDEISEEGKEAYENMVNIVMKKKLPSGERLPCMDAIVYDLGVLQLSFPNAYISSNETIEWNEKEDDISEKLKHGRDILLGHLKQHEEILIENLGRKDGRTQFFFPKNNLEGMFTFILFREETDPKMAFKLDRSPWKEQFDDFLDNKLINSFVQYTIAGKSYLALRQG